MRMRDAVAARKPPRDLCYGLTVMKRTEARRLRATTVWTWRVERQCDAQLRTLSSLNFAAFAGIFHTNAGLKSEAARDEMSESWNPALTHLLTRGRLGLAISPLVFHPVHGGDARARVCGPSAGRALGFFPFAASQRQVSYRPHGLPARGRCDLASAGTRRYRHLLAAGIPEQDRLVHPVLMSPHNKLPIRISQGRECPARRGSCHVRTRSRARRLDT